MNRSGRWKVVLALCLAFGISPAWAGNGLDELIEQGETQAGEGKLDEALATLQSAVDSEPGSSLAYTRLGGVQVLRQEYGASIKSFQQAIMLDQGNADAFIGMAVAYLHTGQYPLAREALKEAGELAPAKKQEIGNVLAWLDQRSGETGH